MNIIINVVYRGSYVFIHDMKHNETLPKKIHNNISISHVFLNLEISILLE